MDHQFIISADDFGISPAVSAGILELLDHGQIDATSCMTVSPHWPEMARSLSDFGKTADIGLHLCLTQFNWISASGRDTRPLSLADLWRKIALGQFSKSAIATEIMLQLDAFESAIGHTPAFVDGHHHVHQLPIIGKTLCEVITARYPKSSVYVRNCRARHGLGRGSVTPSKASLLSLPSHRLRRTARKMEIPMNDFLEGVYDFDIPDYGTVFRRFVSGPKPGRTIIMCHPGRVDDALAQRDSVTDQREHELAFLLSGDHNKMIEDAGGVRSGFWSASRETAK